MINAGLVKWYCILKHFPFVSCDSIIEHILIQRKQSQSVSIQKQPHMTFPMTQDGTMNPRECLFFRRWHVNLRFVFLTLWVLDAAPPQCTLLTHRILTWKSTRRKKLNKQSVTLVHFDSFRIVNLSFRPWRYFLWPFSG